MRFTSEHCYSEVRTARNSKKNYFFQSSKPEDIEHNLGKIKILQEILVSYIHIHCPEKHKDHIFSLLGKWEEAIPLLISVAM